MLPLPCPWSRSARRAPVVFLAVASLAVPCLAVADVGTEALPDYLEALREDPDFVAVSIPGSSPNVDRVTKFLAPARNDPALLGTLFQNANLYAFHHEFLRAVFPSRFPGLTESEYLDLVERRATRDYHAGTLTRYYAPGRGYVLGFTVFTDGATPAELLEANEVLGVYKKLQAAVTIGLPLEYAPLRTAEILKARGWTNPGFPIYLYPSAAPADVVGYAPAVNFGRVRIFTLAELAAAQEAGSIGWQDILVLDDAPPDIETVVGGVVTAVPQGELSHLAIRLARRGVPNAYVRNARSAFASFGGKLVRLAVETSRYEVREASLEEAETWWAEHRPSARPLPQPDEDHGGLEGITEIDPAGPVPAIRRFGGKAAGLARLYRFLPPAYQTQGFAIPFRRYLEFLRANRIPSLANPAVQVSYAEYIDELLEDPRFRADGGFRREALEAFIEHAEDFGIVDAALIASLADRIGEVFGDTGVKVRFRSSSNAEDSIEFNAAGLHESTSVCVLDDLDGDTEGPSRCDPAQDKERTVARGLKRVWMSLWLPRAFEEREYFQMDHRMAAMAVLVTRAYPAEDSNGVAFTGNPANRFDRAYLINAQIGDTDVVTPGPGIECEKDALIMDSGKVGRIFRARASSLVIPGRHVLPDAQLEELGEVLALVDREFLAGVDLEGHSRDEVLVDVEFKFQDGQLVLKQARPFLLSDQSPPGLVFRIEVPPATAACGLWEEFRHPDDEYRLKARLHFREGSIALPLRAGMVLAPLVELLELGPDRIPLEPINSGVLAIADAAQGPGPVQHRWSFDQDFDAGGAVLRLSADFFFSSVGGVPEVGVIVIGEDLFRFERAVHGAFLGPDGSLVDTLRFGSCTYPTLPLWEISADFGNGNRALFHERYEEPFAGSGPANVVRGEVWLGDLHAVETSYWKLVYGADHHNWNEEFRIIFDAPREVLGTPGVKAFHLQEGFHEIPRGAWLLDEQFATLLELPVLAYSKVMIGGSVPGAFRRGEANGDGAIDISDAVATLGWLFLGSSEPWCLDAADSDDSGSIDLSDAVYTLQYLFLAGDPPVHPGPFLCGGDETPDELGTCSGPPPGCSKATP